MVICTGTGLCALVFQDIGIETTQGFLGDFFVALLHIHPKLKTIAPTSLKTL